MVHVLLRRVAGQASKHSGRYTLAAAHFHSSSRRRDCRIFDPIRNEGDFHTAQRLSTTANVPIITYWTAAYCPPCKTVKPLIRDLLEKEGCRRGWKLQYVEVEVDAPEPYMSELMMQYSIRTLPTILPFCRGFPDDNRRLTDVKLMSNREQLTEWLDKVSRSTPSGTGSSGFFQSLFGG